MRATDQLAEYADLFVGIETEIPLLDGSRVCYLNFDNAASTPALKSVRQGVNNFLDYYASVHRGTGFKSQLSTWAYEQARALVFRFLEADPQEHTCILGKNTTEAINKLARRLGLGGDDVVISTQMEHHSNDLPYRGQAQVIHIGLLPDGRIDEDDFDARLMQFGGRVRLVAITGASNVTGYLNPIHRLAAKTHAVGAYFFADCAQLAPHRQISMRPLSDPEHLDFVAISGHKLYAPFGTGALVGRKDVFARGEPDMPGGGTVELVTLEGVDWAAPPDRDEAGSPNVVGAVALGYALQTLLEIGMDQVAAHEAALTSAALKALAGIPGVQIYGDAQPAHAANRLGVVPFQVEGLSHFLVAAILGHEFGIGVRSGCFCAHPYVLHLLQVDEENAEIHRQRILSGDRSEMPGLLRASFGLYNTLAEVERFARAVEAITQGEYRGTYHQDVSSGEFIPDHWRPDFPAFVDLQ